MEPFSCFVDDSFCGHGMVREESLSQESTLSFVGILSLQVLHTSDSLQYFYYQDTNLLTNTTDSLMSMLWFGTLLNIKDLDKPQNAPPPS